MNPVLPSAAALIDSFLKDLQGIASLFAGSSKAQRPLVFENGTNVTTPVKWKADRDYVVRGIHYPSGYNVCVSVSGRSTAPAGSGSGNVSDGILLLTTSTTGTTIPPIRVPLFKDQTLQVWMGGTQGVVTVYLEEA